jgi:hypothetical protein
MRLHSAQSIYHLHLATPLAKLSLCSIHNLIKDRVLVRIEGMDVLISHLLLQVTQLPVCHNFQGYLFIY